MYRLKPKQGIRYGEVIAVTEWLLPNKIKSDP